MLRRYLARRKMRWAVRHVAQMSPEARKVWRLYRCPPSIVIQYTKLSTAEAKKAARVERLWCELLDRLNPSN